MECGRCTTTEEEEGETCLHSAACVHRMYGVSGSWDESAVPEHLITPRHTPTPQVGGGSGELFETGDATHLVPFFTVWCRPHPGKKEQSNTQSDKASV